MTVEDGAPDVVPRRDDVALERPRDLALDALDHAEYLAKRFDSGGGAKLRYWTWLIAAPTYALLAVARELHELTAVMRKAKR